MCSSDLTIIDQLNFQISCFDNLTSPTARALAQPQVATMRHFIKQLANEVSSSMFDGLKPELVEGETGFGKLSPRLR